MRKSLALAITSVFCLSAAACTDEGGARKTLTQAGYTDIAFCGHDAFADWKHPIACDEDDTKTCFTAVNPAKQHVEGVVCGGVFMHNIAIDRTW